MVYDKLGCFRHIIGRHFSIGADTLGSFHFYAVSFRKVLKGIVGGKQNSAFLRNFLKSFLGIAFQLLQLLPVGFLSFFDNRLFRRKLFFQGRRHGGHCQGIEVLIKPKMGIRHVFSLEGLNHLILREVLGNHHPALGFQGILHFPFKM